MKFPTAFLTLFLTLVVVNASIVHNQALGARNLRRHSTVRAPPLEKKSYRKRCMHRGNTSSNTPTTEKGKPAKTTLSKSSPTPSPSGDLSSSNSKVLEASSKCGPAGAVVKTTKTSGPNGSIGFLNCGVDGGGWTPPAVDIKDVNVVSLSEAIKSNSSPFHACAEYVQYFNKYGDQYGIPPIFLASFAMQESSCKPETVGGAGEQGLMQITKDKCGGAPNGNCRDPDFNIHTGAKYFASTLDSVGGNVLVAIGTYNGWYRGLTTSKAEAAKYRGCCRCQQNLDYLHQFLNGWCQNIDAYDAELGHYFNLASCPIG